MGWRIVDWGVKSHLGFAQLSTNIRTACTENKAWLTRRLVFVRRILRCFGLRWDIWGVVCQHTIQNQRNV